MRRAFTISGDRYHPRFSRLSQLTSLHTWRALHRFLLDLPPAIVLTGLGCVALAASSDLANSFDAPRHGGPVVAVLLLLTLLLAFVGFIAATQINHRTSAEDEHAATPPHIRWRYLRYLIYPILLWSLWTAIQTTGVLAQGTVAALTVAPPRYGSDDMYYNHYNALLVLHGENPYAGPWLAREVAYFQNRAYTPIARGHFANPYDYPTQAQMDAIVGEYLAHPQSPPLELDPRTTHSYPAGAFLVSLPAVWAGAPSSAIEQIALALLLGVLVVWTTPPRWRLLIALLLLVDADGARQIVGSDFEIWPLALLAFAWLSRERRWWSVLLLSVACAIKQTAWLAAPFYLIWVWRAYGPREALRRLGIAVAAFFVINLPWIVASPRAWASSLLLPVSLPLLPDGSGIVGLSLAGLFPLAPSVVYALLELAALAGALAWYWRMWPRYPFAVLVLPLLPLVFAWRSSERYFVLLPLAAIVALALTLGEQQRVRGVRERGKPAPADASSAAAGAG